MADLATILAKGPTQLGWRRLPKAAADPRLPYPVQPWQKDLPDGHLTVLVARESIGWHLSISHRKNFLVVGQTPLGMQSHHPPGRYPSWDEIVEARYCFLPKEITVAMILPPPDEYLNVHETCFHLHEMEPSS